LKESVGCDIIIPKSKVHDGGNMKTENEIKQPLQGKRIAVTGTTGGLGREICSYLASLGAHLVLADRNAERSEQHKISLCERFPNSEVTCITLDLEDISSAEIAVRKLVELDIDIFIHNAGAYSIPRRICSCGYDNVFTINFASPYYIIRKLLLHLRKKQGKVVAVGSIAHNYSVVDPDDIDFSTRKAASKVYGNAKRFLMFSLFELFKNEKDVKLSVVHPGITLTNITAHYPKFVFAVIKYPMKVIFMSPKKAALSILEGVFDDCGYCEWIGPRFFDIWGPPKKRKLKSCKSEERKMIAEIAENVFSVCEETAKNNV